jgi:methionyl aminopeptidase
VDRLVHGREDGARVLEETLARWEQRHPARRPGEERGAELVFQRADLPAERRLRDVQALRRAADVSFLRDGNEIADLSETHGRSMGPAARGCKRSRSKRYWTGSARPRHGRVHPVIEILSVSEIERMRRAGRAAARTLAFVGSALRPGMSTADIDRLVREDTARRRGRPSQLGYNGFPAAVCTSKNHVVCHGIPSAHERLEPGDIINIDVTTQVDGYHGDTSAMFVIGEASPQAQRLVDVARRCRDAGIAVIRDGARLGDIGAAIQELATREGVGVVTELGGHGIGRKMHADPHVSHVGKRGTGPRLKTGMALTVEPMVNLGSAAVRFLDDEWTVVTADGSLSAQWEHTVLVTREGHEIMTLP